LFIISNDEPNTTKFLTYIVDYFNFEKYLKFKVKSSSSCCNSNDKFLQKYDVIETDYKVDTLNKETKVIDLTKIIQNYNLKNYDSNLKCCDCNC
jgi:hypothetical protein